MKILLIMSNILSLVVIAIMMWFQVAEHENVHERFASIAGWAKTVEDRLKAQTADTTLSRLNEQDERNKAFALFDTSVTNDILTQGKWNDGTDLNIKLVHDFATAINRELQIWEKGENDHFLQNLDFAIKVNANINKLSGRVDALEHPAVAR
jgi:hypothetical protein